MARRTLGSPASEHRRLRPENRDMAVSRLKEAVEHARNGQCKSAVRMLADGARWGGISDTHLSSSATKHSPAKGKRFGKRTDKAVAEVIKFCLVQGRRGARDH